MEYQLNDFTCCPRCTNATSKGKLVTDDCFLESKNIWLHYIKCINCGWRFEVKKLAKTVVLK